MKRMIMTLAGIVLTGIASAVTIEQVIVRQQWPWSTDIKVEYKLADVSGPVDLTVRAYDGNEELDPSRLAESVCGTTYGITKGGIGTFVIDPIKAFGTSEISLANFKIKLIATDSAANISEILYKIYDLKSGSCENVTRADLLNGKYGAFEKDYSRIGVAFGAVAEEFSTPLDDVLIWTGVTNNVKYKTSHLVMRKIPANGKSYIMGTNATQSLGKTAANQVAHNVSFTNDYFMSVFEVTEGQFLTLVTNSSYSIASTMTFTNANDRYMRPYTGKIITDIRPSIGDFPASGHTITTEKSFMHILRTLVSDDGFDLPTEAFWEYACRAGSTNDLYIGQNYTAARMGMLARWSENSGSDVTDNTPAAEGGTAIVGSYAPNAWGLYDMYGNYAEMCLDRVCEDLSPYSGDDPWGAPESAVYYHRVVRGGAYVSTTSTGLYSSYRTSGNSTGVSGIRLCLTVY